MQTDDFYDHPFLAAIYDAWHPRYVRNDFDFYLPMIMKAGSTLDVGCGTGTLLHEARSLGHTGRLCGIDPASGVIGRASLYPNIEWVLGQLPSQGWSDEFDLIVMTGHAFQTLVSDQDLQRFLTSIRSALLPSGQFVFETRNPLATAWERWSPQNKACVTMPDGSTVTIETNVVHPFDQKTVTFTHTFRGLNPVLPRTSPITLRFMEADSLREHLEAAKLRVVNQFGDFDGRSFEPDSPEILTFASR